MKTGPTWSSAYQYPWRWELLPTNGASPDFWDWKPSCRDACQDHQWNGTELQLVDWPHFPCQVINRWRHCPAGILVEVCRYTVWCFLVISRGHLHWRDHASDCTWHRVLHVALVWHSKCAQPSATEHVSWQRACRTSAPDKMNLTTREPGWRKASSAHHVDISSRGLVRCLLGPYLLRHPLAPSSQIWWPPGGVKWQGRWCGPCWQPSSLLKGKRSLCSKIKGMQKRKKKLPEQLERERRGGGEESVWSRMILLPTRGNVESLQQT